MSSMSQELLAQLLLAPRLPGLVEVLLVELLPVLLITEAYVVVIAQLVPAVEHHSRLSTHLRFPIVCCRSYSRSRCSILPLDRQVEGAPVVQPTTLRYHVKTDVIWSDNWGSQSHY